MLTSVPKVKRLKDRKLIRDWPRKRCEICGAITTCEAHHILSVGSGGPDHPYNLISLCIWGCHVKAHKAIYTKECLFKRVAIRENVAYEVVETTVWELKV